MEHQHGQWAARLGATDHEGQKHGQTSAAINMAHQLPQTDQPYTEQMRQHAILADITRKQEELQRMAAAQSAAHRELMNLLSSVAPANRSGSVVDNRLASGMQGGNFDSKTLATATFDASKLGSHLTPSAELSVMRSQNHLPSNTAFAAAQQQQPPSAIASSIDSTLSNLWPNHDIQNGIGRSVPQSHQPLAISAHATSCFPKISNTSFHLGLNYGAPQQQQPVRSNPATFPAALSDVGLSNSLQHGIPIIKPSGAAQPHQSVLPLGSTFPSLFGPPHPQQPLQQVDF
eukprot:533000-Rhodomonas_salina.1